MSEVSQRITDVLLLVSTDPGHGGPFSEYKIDSADDRYTVTLTIFRLFPTLGSPGLPAPPAFGKPQLERSQLTEVLEKEDWQVKEFLNKLSTDFNVYKLVDLKPQYPFLHPTFYSFRFRDSEDKQHCFKYHIECSNHLDETYERLIQEFDSFFESRRIFNTFFERQREN